MHDAVRAGRYASDDVIRDALVRLRQALPEAAQASGKSADHAMPARQQQKKSLTKDEFHRHLVEIGLMSQLPDTEADYDDPDDEPISIQGEQLSETIIRERR